MAWERLVTHLGEAARARGHEDARPVEHQLRVEALAPQARGHRAPVGEEIVERLHLLVVDECDCALGRCAELGKIRLRAFARVDNTRFERALRRTGKRRGGDPNRELFRCGG